VSKLVAGIGLSSSATADELRGLLDEALAAAGANADDLDAVATLISKADDERIRALGLPTVGFDAAELDAVQGTAANSRVRAEVATASVAEAAALLAAGEGAVLVVPKRRSAHATVALAGAPGS
jgi:cobalamin biosynthesis protein CbiG